MIKAVLAAVLLLVAARFGLFVWRGYRDGRVRTVGPVVVYLDRPKQPTMYWLTMGVHSLVVVAFVGCTAAILLGIAPLR
jgi:hypothetical protein